VVSPRSIEVEFPYGDIIDSEAPSSEEDRPDSRMSEQSRPGSSKKRKNEDDKEKEHKGRKNFSKYSDNILNDLITPDLNNEHKIFLPAAMQNEFWIDKYDKLTSLAVSSSTWKCRLASFHKFKKFLIDTKNKLTWPLKHEIINGFVTWCFEKKELSYKTTKTYLTHLNSIQKLLGFKKFNQNKYNLKTLLKGFKNGENLRVNYKRKRETIDFKNLNKIKTAISNLDEGKIFKKCLWSACSTAFFGCFRMGELLPKSETTVDKKFDLLWGDIKLRKKHAAITLKSQKNRILNKQIIHIFKFRDKVTCPIAALHKLKKQAKKNGIFSKLKPVFAVDRLCNLTQRKVNNFLKKSFPNNKFSGHSFRAGVPSSLADFPNIANDWHVMGWGRWRSNIFLKYQNRTKEQSKWVFKKIEKCLL